MPQKFIKYTALLNSGISSQQASKLYGISEPPKVKVRSFPGTYKEATEIQNAVNKLSLVQERCLLESLGIIDIEKRQDRSDKSQNEDENDGEE